MGANREWPLGVQTAAEVTEGNQAIAEVGRLRPARGPARRMLRIVTPDERTRVVEVTIDGKRHRVAQIARASWEVIGHPRVDVEAQTIGVTLGNWQGPARALRGCIFLGDEDGSN